MTKVMISQPRYLPSISYLERIQKADIFVILDTVQRVERGFENRNKIKDRNGVEKWLTIPIKSSNRTLIKDTFTNGLDWRVDHYNMVKNYYGNAKLDKYFEDYLTCMDTERYADSLVKGLIYLKVIFNLDTQFVLASTISNVSNGGIDELVRLVKAVNGDTYISGPTCLEYGFTNEYAHSHDLILEIDRSTKYMPWIETIEKG
jgi:hypothetical protein